MSNKILEDLLTTLDVRVHAFAVCEIQRGYRLNFAPMQAVVVHYVLAGHGVLHQIGDTPRSFGPGAIMFVAPGCAQSLACGDPESDVAADRSCGLLADGLFRFEAGENAAELIVVCGTITATFGGSFGLFDHQTGPIVEDAGGLPHLRGAFEILVGELAQPRTGTRALTEALMKQCLIVLLRDQLTRFGSATPLFRILHHPRLAQAVAVILAQPGAAHTVESLATAAGMSRTVFAERFAVAYGQTPAAFIQAARLRSAARLLSISDMPIKAIASSIGYASRSHFSRAFKAAFGLDPSRYRLERAANDELERELADASPISRLPVG